MTPSQPEPLTDPRFEGFTLRLSPGSDPAMTEARARKALDTSLKKVLGSSATGWKVTLIRPGECDLRPPKIGELKVDEAWDVAYALQERPSVIDAEPSFEIIPDFGDVNIDAEEEDMAAAAGDPPIFSKHDHEWCSRLVDAVNAWNVPPQPGGASKGKGIVIGHPDSGYREHAEIRDNPNRFRDDLGFDFIGDEEFEEDEDGGHGLGTASVLMSAIGGTGAKFITGVAPEATIIPYRVTRPHSIFPSPVLFRSGMLRLADAIERAVDRDKCDVISISLGWLPNERVHRAVRKAFDKDVIVVAAAGNRIRVLVVWPAHYEQVISCAGCTSKRRQWSSSSRGKRVDVTGPAEHVWKAAIDGSGSQVVQPSSGTSFAAACVAGLAALWLAHWGKKNLLDHYQGEFRLATVFRRVLMASCDPEPEGADGQFGAGIVNAKRLLETKLPTIQEMKASSAPILEAVAMAAAEPAPVAGLETIAASFDDMPQPQLRSRLSAALGIAEPDLDDRLSGVGRELVFHILTDPALRESVLSGAVTPAPLAATAEAAAMAMAPQRLQDAPLSQRLRSRINIP